MTTSDPSRDHVERRIAEAISASETAGNPARLAAEDPESARELERHHARAQTEVELLSLEPGDGGDHRPPACGDVAERAALEQQLRTALARRKKDVRRVLYAAERLSESLAQAFENERMIRLLTRRLGVERSLPGIEAALSATVLGRLRNLPAAPRLDRCALEHAERALQRALRIRPGARSKVSGGR
jgi:hypothetical protein